MKKRLFLDFAPESDENNIIGIISSLSHLQFVHFLNKTEHFNFIRNEEIIIEKDNGAEYFINFTHRDLIDGHICRLIKTQDKQELLAKKIKTLDYILVINSENDNELNITTDLLKKCPFIQVVLEIEKYNIFRNDRKKIMAEKLFSMESLL